MDSLRKSITAVFVCLLVVVAIPALADVEIPDEWFGIWELEVVGYDCDSEMVIFSSTSLDSICEGSMFVDPDPSSFPIECTGSADADSYTLHCEGSQEVIPGCTANFVYDSDATRDGDSYSSVTITSITYTGDCSVIPDSCQRIEVTGTRIDDAPDPCDEVPVETRSWSTVKSFYR